MIMVGNSDFAEYIDREVAEREKERFRKKYADAKRIPVPGKRKGLWQRVREKLKK